MITIAKSSDAERERYDLWLKPSFEEIMTAVAELEEQINHLGT